MADEKKYIAALAVGAAAGIWCASRDRKYPVCRELRFVNKLAVPGWAISLSTAKLSNRMLDRMPLPDPPQDVARGSIRILSEDGTPFRLTIYQPQSASQAAPCLVYFHGGGFCVRDAGYIHRYAAQYAQGAQCKVVFIHYRTADEAPFPAPFQDCYTALRWVWEHSDDLGIDLERIAVGGDSAGGALTAACALRVRDEGEIRLCFQLLVYPVTDSRMETDSIKKFTDSPMWNADLNRRTWKEPATDLTSFGKRIFPVPQSKSGSRRCGKDLESPTNLKINKGKGAKCYENGCYLPLCYKQYEEYGRTNRKGHEFRRRCRSKELSH